MIWAAIILGSLGCWIEKLLGYLVPASVLRNPWLMRVAILSPVALLAALVAVQTFGDGQALTLDARAAGLAVAIIALILRAPFLVVIVVSAVTAALLRATGWGS